jgi:hypothetical protein
MVPSDSARDTSPNIVHLRIRVCEVPHTSLPLNMPRRDAFAADEAISPRRQTEKSRPLSVLPHRHAHPMLR